MAVIVTVGMDDELLGVGCVTPPLEAGGVTQPAGNQSEIRNKPKSAANGRRVYLEQLSLVPIT
jgi:hypothetical protein